ncbi:MAG: nucleoside deaminase [Desulfobulbaceae bacterium]|nr:nucleoside deaminase [Desulfobulbaceae bacterium]HIJ78450.1 nucleoside deaminase [Deltaproteobacteria bacterium]
MHEKFMSEAIRLATEKMQNGDGGPFGAVIVMDGRIISRGWNQVTSTNDPTAHAEIVAIRNACRQINNFSLAGGTLYVNCEPCPMCMAAAYWAEIATVYYGTTRKDAAAIGFADDHIHQELSLPNEERVMNIKQIMRDQALPAFALWESMADKIKY